MEQHQAVFLEFLRLISRCRDASAFVEASVAFFHRHSGCDAVGIRLRDGDDFPYREARGFSPGFLQSERGICAHSEDGCPLRDTQGKAVLRCLCGDVVSGDCDLARNHLTASGSFHVNDFSAFANSLTAEQREKNRVRGRCAVEGFQSVALLPLAGKTGWMGLLQLNARQKDWFTPEFLAFWERMAGTFSVALQQFQQRDELKQECARLKGEVFRISEREQQRIAQELHDGLCQHLAGTAMVSRGLFNKLAERHDPAAEDMARICGLLSTAVEETRNLSHGLYAVPTEEGGLAAAFMRLARNISALFPVRCLFRSSGNVQMEDEIAATHLYRIAQEAVNNAIKHGEADCVQIRLQRKRKAIVLTIEDNGCGVPTELPATHGIGLQIMAHRAVELGGRVEVRPGRRGGTVVSCTIPA